MNEIDLSGLKDIHIPIEPSWWPPALGWWFALIGGIILLGSGVWCFFYWLTRPRQYALRELKRFYQTTDNIVFFAKQVSSLLKRNLL